jgi:hypothetical protein
MRHLLLLAMAATALAGCETIAEEAAQITGDELVATLSPVGGGGGSGRAVIALNDTTNQVCTDLEVSGIGPVTAAHIHSGATGPAYFDIEVENDNDTDDCDVTSDDLLDYMRRNPGAFWVDVHTSDRPAGALRGRLRLDSD